MDAMFCRQKSGWFTNHTPLLKFGASFLMLRYLNPAQYANVYDDQF